MVLFMVIDRARNVKQRHILPIQAKFGNLASDMYFTGKSRDVKERQIVFLYHDLEMLLQKNKPLEDGACFFKRIYYSNAYSCKICFYAFGGIPRTRFELVSPPWKGGVLGQARRRGHKNVSRTFQFHIGSIRRKWMSRTGIEPVTTWLKVRCSTCWANGSK